MYPKYFCSFMQMNNSKTNKKIYLILILGLLTSIGPLSIDMYLPAFPDIAKSLHTTGTGNTIPVQFFYWHFCRAIIVWSVAGKIWQKKSFVCRAWYLSFSFHWMCFCSIGKCPDPAQAFAGIRRLCRHGSRTGNGT